MDVFEYDKESSYDSNFTRWHSMNSSERRQFNEEVLSVDHAKQKFAELYKKENVKFHVLKGDELRSYGATIVSKVFS